MPSYSHEKRLSTILELAFGARGSEITLVTGDANGNPIMQDINYSRATGLSLASGNITLSGANAAAMILEVTTGHATNAILAPTTVNGNHYWVINNDAVNNVIIKKSGGTGVTFPPSSAGLVYYNGTDYVLLSNDGKVLTSPAVVSGTPTALATSSLIQLGGTAIAGGSASGTYLGANAATTYAGDMVDLQQNSVLVFQVSSVASAVNGLQVQLAATGNAPQIAPIGSDANINLKLIGKGTGFVDLFGAGFATVSKSALYTATAADSVILTTATTAYTITLPQGAAYKDKAFMVVKDNAAANAITVAGASGQINGAANYALASGAYHGAVFVSDGTNYWIVSSY